MLHPGPTFRLGAHWPAVEAAKANVLKHTPPRS